jgi:predicted nucleic acid-binding protein
MQILVDTGILLRLLDRSDLHHTDIRRALQRLRTRGDALVTSSQNLAEFWNVCTRPTSARGGYGLSVAEAERRVRLLESLFPVLTETPGAYPLWRNLLVAHGVQGVHVHDARLVALMQAHAITHILTLNAADFRRYHGIIVPVSPLEVS